MSGARDVVEDDRVEPLALELRPRALEPSAPCSAAKPTRLAGPPSAADARAARRRSARVDVERSRSAFEIFRLRLGRPVVGHRGRHQQHVAVAEALERRRAELLGGLDLDVCRRRAARERHVGGHHRHVGAAPRRLLGQREAHASAGAVADEAHGVERLPRSARGHEHAQRRRAAAARRCRRPARSPRAAPAARQAGPPPTRPATRAARSRLDHVHAPLAQQAQVRLGGGMLVHVVVHRGREDHGARAGEVGGGQQVVGEAGGELGDRVGRRGRDAEARRSAGQAPGG